MFWLWKSRKDDRLQAYVSASFGIIDNLAGCWPHFFNALEDNRQVLQNSRLVLGRTIRAAGQPFVTSELQTIGLVNSYSCGSGAIQHPFMVRNLVLCFKDPTLHFFIAS